MSEEEKELSFVKERFKDELPSGKRLFYKSLKLVGSGLIFGIAASFAFYVLKPFVENRFAEAPPEISIPQDEEPEEGDNAAVVEMPETQVQSTLTIESYKELHKVLLPIANEVGKSIVEVKGVLADEIWSESYDEKNSVSGIFMADNGQEVLILTYSEVLKEADEVQVIFADSQAYPATLKVQDGNTGLAVVGVAKEHIKESTWNQIEPATLGNSNIVIRGDAVIALGKQHGFAGSMSYGMISSVKNQVEKIDGILGVLNTDMAASHNGTGVLVNLNGEIVGMINQNIARDDSRALVTAYAVSDLKVQINHLLNGKDVPYVGIRGIDITDAIAEYEGLPDGVYVREVIPSSPAMEAGVRVGDIITKVADTDTFTLVGYQRQLMESKVGENIQVAGKRLGNEGYVDIQFDITVGNIE